MDGLEFIPAYRRNEGNPSPDLPNQQLRKSARLAGQEKLAVGTSGSEPGVPNEPSKKSASSPNEGAPKKRKRSRRSKSPGGGSKSNKRSGKRSKKRSSGGKAQKKGCGSAGGRKSRRGGRGGRSSRKRSGSGGGYPRRSRGGRSRVGSSRGGRSSSKRSRSGRSNSTHKGGPVKVKAYSATAANAPINLVVHQNLVERDPKEENLRNPVVPSEGRLGVDPSHEVVPGRSRGFAVLYFSTPQHLINIQITKNLRPQHNNVPKFHICK